MKLNNVDFETYFRNYPDVVLCRLSARYRHRYSTSHPMGTDHCRRDTDICGHRLLHFKGAAQSCKFIILFSSVCTKDDYPGRKVLLSFGCVFSIYPIL